MLVLSRKQNEKILIPGIQASIEVVAIKGNVVRLGIQAPPDVVILREELQGQASGPSSGKQPLANGPEAKLRDLEQLLSTRLTAASVDVALLRWQHEQGLSARLGESIDKVDRELEALRRHLETSTGQAEARPAAKKRRACKTLLVEDDRNERELLASFLRMAGLDVDTAGDGVDALDYLHTRGRPDVVLMDMGLPRCDGQSAVRAIREDPAYAGLKIFAVTGHAPSHFGLNGGKPGVDRWFQKPLNLEDLLRDLNLDVAGLA